MLSAVGDGSGQSACGGWGLDAWMLGWFIRRLPYHSPATCFASGTGVKILDDQPRPRATFCIANKAASLACTAARKEMSFGRRRGVMVVHTYRSAHQPLEVDDGTRVYWAIGWHPTSWFQIGNCLCSTRTEHIVCRRRTAGWIQFSWRQQLAAVTVVRGRMLAGVARLDLSSAI